MTKGTMDSIRYYYNVGRRGLEYMSEIQGESTGDPSIMILRECALDKGMKVEEFVNGTYECTNGKKTRFFGMPPDSGTAIWLCSNKFATYELLKKNGFDRVPYYRKYTLGTINEAREDFKTRDKVAVVKPCSQTFGGTGVTANIRTVRKLNKAIFRSLVYGSEYLVEDHIEGDNFRVLCYGDRMLNVVQRLPANVTGDGANTIKQLIDKENVKRVEDRSPFRLYSIKVDKDVEQTLRDKGMSLNHVPADGERVFLRTVCNHEAGDETTDITSIVHPDVISYCEGIMRTINTTLSGIDIITTDITKPLAESGGVINEVNTSPGLMFHDRATSMKVIDHLFDQAPPR
ncbi:MAG: hypothetical protein ISF22_11135 [Methanomassiliicoccus sp.]|nr:hypothetical protein [Methanomassiliicoccus sp.]